MKQININVTEDFEKDLKCYMKALNLTQKSEAIRRAIHEGAIRMANTERKSDFRSWLGIGLKSPLNPTPRFTTDKDLWK